MENEEKNILIQKIICCDDGGILFTEFDNIINCEEFKILCEENVDINIIYKNLCKDKNSLHENNINFLNLRKCNIYENKIPYQLLLSIHPKIIEMINKLNDTPPTTIFMENNNFHVRNIKENENIIITDPERWGSTERYIYHIITKNTIECELI